MAQPYIGEIRMFGGNFAPAGWEFCNGQLLSIAENDTFFTLIGTTYGGDGQTTFALPDLRGRVPLHFGSGVVQAQMGGTETVTLSVNQIPVHTHPFMASNNPASATSPTGNAPAVAQASTITPYGTDAPLAQLNPAAITSYGGSQPHENMQPYLCVSYIISLFGIFPLPS